MTDDADRIESFFFFFLSFPIEWKGKINSGEKEKKTPRREGNLVVKGRQN